MIRDDMEDQSLSIWLSEAMHRAGFRSTNARVQSAIADCMAEFLRFVLKTDDLHVFGSYSDGWGSCLTKLDGSVESSSDIDVTIIGHQEPIHLTGAKPDQCARNHAAAEYRDGHIISPTTAQAPNFATKKDVNGLMSATDIIIALPCCGYPRIELLLDGYTSRTGRPSNMPEHIMRQLREEVFGNSSRGHAVAASPPGQTGGHLRFSTTFLERIVLRNLSSVQGQLFIIIKFFIKKLICEERDVKGLKTYMAKNLLFYMLDETHPDEWTPSNLLMLVRRSLEMLREMMNSSENSETACMRHFFLRDAAVYFKKLTPGSDETPTDPRTANVLVVDDILKNLPAEIQKFIDTLAEADVNIVLFNPLHVFIFVAEVLAASERMNPLVVYGMIRLVIEATRSIAEDFDGRSANSHLGSLLNSLALIPDEFQFTRECYKAQAYQKVRLSPIQGNQRNSMPPISRGIDCSHLSEEITLQEAKDIALRIMAEPSPLGLSISNGRITACVLERICEGFASLVASMQLGVVPRSEQILESMTRISPIVPLIFLYRNVERTRAIDALTQFTRQSRSLLRGIRPDSQQRSEEPDNPAGSSARFREDDLD